MISSLDFDGDLAEKYDVIVLPSGTTRSRIVNGLSSRRHDASWRWAYGVGEEGWEKLRQWVKAGGTLVALGTAVETARDLLRLPIEPVLPPGGQVAASAPGRTGTVDVQRRLRAGLQNPSDTVEPTSIFYCPGALLHQEHDAAHPIGFGMAERWPVFFRFDQAYRLTPSVDIEAEVVSRYPDEADMSASGWLLGDELLRNQANVISFDVEQGTGGDDGQPDSLQDSSAGNLQAALQRDLPGTSDACGRRNSGHSSVDAFFRTNRFTQRNLLEKPGQHEAEQHQRRGPEEHRLNSEFDRRHDAARDLWRKLADARRAVQEPRHITPHVNQRRRGNTVRELNPQTVVHDRAERGHSERTTHLPEELSRGRWPRQGLYALPRSGPPARLPAWSTRHPPRGPP